MGQDKTNLTMAILISDPQCALVVKRDEIEQLQRVETVKEKKLSRTEKLLEDDAILFDSFLKENDKTSVEAIKVVEQETKEKLEKMEGIKKITTKMFTIKSDISGYKDILKEYMLYKDFLCKLSPVQWQEQQAAKKSLKPTFVTNESGGDKSKQGRTALSEPDRQYQELPSLPEAKHVKSLPQNKILDAVSETDHDSSEYEVEPELYFTQPQQLLDLLTELEEQNLSLIQNSRETEEALEEFRHTMEQTREKMELEADQLKQQIDTMNLSIKKESARAADLELKARLFNFGKDESEDQDGVLTALSHKVEVVYRSCVGNCEASLSALQMLVAIEDRLGELLENMEMIPKERLIIAERAMEREKRIRLRDEKIQQQKHHQEDRLKKALARAQSDIKKTVGKKLMPRSQPPVRKLKTCNFNNSIDKEREEHLYFFT
ncbi:cilia- and flagella-associated protein 100 [Chanos chanos]|uniref:Cilia- and flagella-associated protein 100 n=1 Tax=Chanos chanos TaxID=29144 RepID=A0A6J2UPW1_CHACN|nr:cilia- and flagella-associated protein 100 [Chanos chanos]